jgi:glycosyltransferase involved in cell wall biosynthesis
VFLPTKLLKIGPSRLYFNPSIWGVLASHKADIVITGGFSPTMLVAILYCWFKGVKHGITTDAWQLIERNYSWMHTAIRRIVYAKTSYFIPISKKGLNHLQDKYKIDSHKIHSSPYVINEQYFRPLASDKKFDVLFSGQLISRKMPLFFADVCLALSSHLGRSINVAILGDGPLKEQLLTKLSHPSINLTYPGFVQQEFIPSYFQSSKLFLFPTLEDGWGVVANESLACATPCLISPNAGAADELVINGVSGFVLGNEVQLWVDTAGRLLQNDEELRMLSKKCALHYHKFEADKVVQSLIAFLNEAA